jgi:hypothetical protein
MGCRKALVLVGLLCVVTAPVSAAPKPESAGPHPLTRPFNVDWKGGPLKEFVGGLAAVRDGHLGVAFGPGTGDLLVPAMDLRNTNVFSLAELLDNIVPGLRMDLFFGRQFLDEQNVSSGRAGEISELIVKYGSPTFVFNVHRDALPAKELRVICVDEILRECKINVEDLTDAIETASRMAAGAPGELKFHPKTAMLICSGGEAQVSAMHQVVDAMQKQAMAVKRAREAQKGPAAQVEKLTREIGMLKMELAAQKLQIETLTREKRELLNQLEKANASQSEKRTRAPAHTGTAP